MIKKFNEYYSEVHTFLYELENSISKYKVEKDEISILYNNKESWQLLDDKEKELIVNFKEKDWGGDDKKIQPFYTICDFNIVGDEVRIYLNKFDDYYYITINNNSYRLDQIRELKMFIKHFNEFKEKINVWKKDNYYREF